MLNLFHLDNKVYVTCIDRFSKYLKVFLIKNKLNFHEKLEEILTQNYPNCKTIITDNEAIFISNSSKALYEKYKIQLTLTPVQHSNTNGQVERAHNTLLEISRCLGEQYNSTHGQEIYNAIKDNNNTIHIVTKEKSIDIEKIPINTQMFIKISTNLF